MNLVRLRGRKRRVEVSWGLPLYTGCARKSDAVDAERGSIRESGLLQRGKEDVVKKTGIRCILEGDMTCGAYANKREPIEEKLLGGKARSVLLVCAIHLTVTSTAVYHFHLQTIADQTFGISIAILTAQSQSICLHGGSCCCAVVADILGYLPSMKHTVAISEQIP